LVSELFVIKILFDSSPGADVNNNYYKKVINMCYAIPAKIIKIKDMNAEVDYGGVLKNVNISLIDDPKIGDYILIHAGFAIEKLDKKSARESLEIIRNDLAQFSKEDFEFEGIGLLEKY
jgi:hydrogenase expression/formation protein HypC